MQQKGLAISNRMKRINSNEFHQQKNADTTGRINNSRALSNDVQDSDENLDKDESTDLNHRLDFSERPNMPIGGKADGENMDDPALLTQSSKINYIPFEDLEPLDKPEMELKKCLKKGHGIHSGDWSAQFEACNVIRSVCKHHQSLILATVN